MATRFPEAALPEDFPSTVDENARRRFEAAWRAGSPPSIENFLPSPSDSRYLATLTELVLIEIEFRSQIAPENDESNPSFESYLQRFPILRHPKAIALLAEQEQSLRRKGAYVDLPTSVDNRGSTPLENRKPIDDTFPRIAGFEFLGLLGRGGMGRVYKARQTALNRVVAVKMVLGGGADAEDLIRFRREAEVIAQLQHPNIVQIFEVGEHDGLPFLTLEFVDGDNLSRRCGGKPQTPQTAARIVQSLAYAVQYAHERGILHRDLKPANVLLKDSYKPADATLRYSDVAGMTDSFGIPKITDFGLAKRMDVQGQTKTGDIIGTPAYMAPEQAAGRTRDLGATTDVYALGAILYELLTGRPPFLAATSAATLLAVLNDEPARPRRLQPSTPADIETICMKCLEKQPHRRYASAVDLADDLGRYLRDEPIKARSVLLLERAWRWSRRNPKVAMLMTLLAATVAVGFTTVTYLWLHARAQSRRAEAGFNRASELTGKLADARFDVGKLTAEMSTVSPAESIAAFEQARDLFEEYVAHQPGNSKHLATLATCYHNLGHLYGVTGKSEESVLALTRARDLHETLLSVEPKNPTRRMLLAETSDNLGIRLASLRRLEEAKTCSDRAGEILDALVNEHPDNSRYRRDQAEHHYLVATREFNLGRLEPARIGFERGIAAYESIVENNKRNVGFRRDWMKGIQNLAVVHFRAGNRPAAIDARRRVCMAAEQLASEFPAVADYQRFQGEQFLELGAAQAEAGRFPDAFASFRTARSVLEKLVHEIDANPRSVQTLGRLYLQLASLHSRNQEPKLELEILRKLVDTYEPLTKNREFDRTSTGILSNAYFNLSIRLNEQQKAAESLGYLKKRHGLWADRVRIDPKDLAARNALAASERDIAYNLRDANQLQDAVTSLVRAVDIWRQLMLETNEDNDVRHNLGRDLDSLGDCRFKLGCKEEAEVNFREAIQHQSLVVKKAPQHYPWLCQHYQRLGRLLRDADRPKDAIAVAKDWRAQMPEDAGTLFNVAREFALSVPVFGRVRGQPAPTVAADQQACIDEAINALRQAFEKGFRTRDALRTDSAFEAIRDQPEFKRLAQQAKGSD